MATPILRLADFRVSLEENEGTASFEGFDSASWCFTRWKTNQHMDVVRHYFHVLNHDLVICRNRCKDFFHFIH